MAVPRWGAVLLVLSLLLVGGIGAAAAQPTNTAPGPASTAERAAPAAEPFWRIRMRVGATRPRRLEEPLRGVNISDEEVRQIEQATRALAPGALVNIGPVTTGCPCEDGPDCSDRVWVVAYSPAYSQGLMLSRLAGRWQLGALQAWWLEHDALHGRPFPPPAASPQPDAAPVYPRHDALQQLWEAYPECVVAE